MSKFESYKDQIQSITEILDNLNQDAFGIKTAHITRY